MQTVNPWTYDHTQRPDAGLRFLDAAALWGSFTKQALRDVMDAVTDDAAEWAIIRAARNARYAGTAARLALSELAETYDPPCCEACEDAPAVEDFGGMAFCPTCAPQWFVCDRCHEAQKVEGQQVIEHPKYPETVCMGCWEGYMDGPDGE